MTIQLTPASYAEDARPQSTSVVDTSTMDEQRTQEHDNLVHIGQVIDDRYEVVEHLGTGGFAKVYRAHDRRIERDAAIKFLDLRGMNVADQTINNILERFSREAKLAAKIPHRSVVNIYDIGQVDEDPYRPFIVMELLHGLDLQEVLDDEGAMPPARLIPLFVDALDGLGKAHDMGIVHKDLKPSNLFLSDPKTRGETIRLVDFGIAHIKSGNTPEEEAQLQEQGHGRLTATGQILGTLQYMAPEYIGSQLVSPALDVYQMGLILVEMLSGQPVIKTSNAFECLRIHTFGLLELPSYLLESPLGDVLRMAIHAEHEQRYPDATAFANALSELDPTSIPSSPLLSGSKTLSTAQYQNAVGLPGAPSTDTHTKPHTGDFLADHIAMANTLGPEDAPAQHLSANAINQQATEAELNLNNIDTLAPTNADSIGQVELNHHHAATLPEIDLSNEKSSTPSSTTPALLTPPEPKTKTSTGLKAGLAMLVLAIFVALGIIGAIVLRKQPVEPPKVALTTPKSQDSIKVDPVKITPKSNTPISEPTKPKVIEATPKVAVDTPPTPPKIDKKTARTGRTVEVLVFPTHAKTKIGRTSYSGSFEYTFKGRKKSVRATISAPNYTSKTITLSKKKDNYSVSLSPKANLADDPALKKLMEDKRKALEIAARKRKTQEAARMAEEKKKREAIEAEIKAKQKAEAQAKARIEAEKRKAQEAAKKAKEANGFKIVD